jgi:hypothetical protein
MGQCAGLKRPCTGPCFEGRAKKDMSIARHTVAFMNKAEAFPGRELGAERLMAERKREGHLLRRKLSLPERALGSVLSLKSWG